MLSRSNSFRSFLPSICALLAACDEGVAAVPSGPVESSVRASAESPAGEESALHANVRRCLPIAFSLPRFIAGNVHSSRSTLVEAVYFATGAQHGQITMTGTITVAREGVTYAPTPADRLVVKLGGEVHEFVVKEVQGDNQAASAAGWLASPHILHYTHKLGERADAEIRVKFDGKRFEANAKGFVKVGGTRYDANLTAVGATEGTRDLDGFDIATRYDLTGKITGAGCEIAVSEHHVLKSAGAYSMRLLTTQRGSASQTDARLANVLKCDGATYALSNVELRTETVDKGKEQRSGITAVSGQVVRDGAPFATCALQNGAVYAMAGTQVLRLDDIAAN